MSTKDDYDYETNREHYFDCKTDYSREMIYPDRDLYDGEEHGDIFMGGFFIQRKWYPGLNLPNIWCKQVLDMEDCEKFKNVYYVAVQNDFEEDLNLANLFPVSVSDNTEILSDGEKVILTEEQLNRVKDFARKYKDELIDVMNQGDFMPLFERLKDFRLKKDKA